MNGVTLTINSPQGTQKVPLADESLTIGRGAPSAFVIEGDSGLSRRHATIHRDGEQVWVVDENSTNGSFVNGEPVAPKGTPLRDGDEIRIGNYTTIIVRFRQTANASASPAAVAIAAPGANAGSSSSNAAPPASRSLMLVVPIAVIFVFLLLGGVGFILYKATTKSATDDRAATGEYEGAEQSDGSGLEEATTGTNEDADELSLESSPVASAPNSSSSITDNSSASSAASGGSILNNSADPLPIAEAVAPPPVGEFKIYQKMSDDEKREFIKQRASKIAVMMGNRPYAIPPDALDEIKYWLDAFSKRIGNNRTGLWGGDTRFIFDRARTHAPMIIQAFKEHRVPVVIGLYIPFIETEYTNITTDNFAGAAGLFQFLGPTAESYGVPSAERTNVARMAPAAAKYFRDNIMRFGDDSMSVALSIAGYNRAPESVMRDLRNVLSEKDNTAKERTFWTLIANKGKLDHYFQNENKNYVPRFFAAAIMGENPWAFGLQMRPLSTYTQINNQQLAGQPQDE
jgi:hypothetical protein